MTPSGLRELIAALFGFDPGPLRPADRLEDLGLSDVERLLVVSSIEARHGVEFPADLVAALETVDDLTHYTAVKLGQRNRAGAAT